MHRVGRKPFSIHDSILHYDDGQVLERSQHTLVRVPGLTPKLFDVLQWNQYIGAYIHTCVADMLFSPSSKAVSEALMSQICSIYCMHLSKAPQDREHHINELLWDLNAESWVPAVLEVPLCSPRPPSSPQQPFWWQVHEM